MIILRGDDDMAVAYQSSSKARSKARFISCAQLHRHVPKGCEVFLGHVKDTRIKDKGIDEIPVVREFPDVFPAEIVEMPPRREVEFP